MKKFSCGDVVPGCNAVFEAEHEDGILSQVAKHAHADHGLSDVPPALVEAVKLRIHDADHA